MAELFWSPALPLQWVVKMGSYSWLVKAVLGGWAQRTPYQGHTIGLESVRSPEEAHLILASLGVSEEA